MAELMVWVAFVIFLIIMIYTVQNISIYTSLVSLGCSMFINLMYLNTFYLKAFRQMEISLYSLTLCMDFLKQEPNPTPRQILRVLEPEKVKIIEYVHAITYRAVTLNFFRRICDKINLSIEAGDRIVVSGNSNSYKETIFYMLDNRLFDCESIKGDLVINGEVRREFYIDGLFYLHSDPILPFLGTLIEAVRYSRHGTTEEELDRQFAEFFEELDLQPVFSSGTEVDQLSLDQKELFEVFRVVLVEECKVLVILSGLDDIDIVSRRKLTKWLMRRKSLNIIIETTNLREMVELYPKQYVFEGQKLRLQLEKDPEM
jgi:ABC-type multidrug transport system fused ATPase/permease subunit